MNAQDNDVIENPHVRAAIDLAQRARSRGAELQAQMARQRRDSGPSTPPKQPPASMAPKVDVDRDKPLPEDVLLLLLLLMIITDQR